MLWFFKRHSPWLSSAFIGVLLIAAGVFFIVKGADAKAQVRAGLVEEQIRTGKDTVQFGEAEGTLVTDAKSALAQANTIKLHTMGQWGPYSQMARTDPNRATYLDGVALRTALNLAVMGFGVADMALGAGVIILIAGVATLLLAAPALFLLAGVAFPRQGKRGPSQLTSAAP